MKVKLIQITQNPIDVMWTAARTCYSAKSPNEMWEDKYGEVSDECEYTQEWIEQCTEKHWNLVKKVLDSGHSCYDEETEVLTSKGFKFWKDITEDDLIASVEPITHKMHYEKPIRLISSEYNGKMYLFDNKYINLCVTPNHRLYSSLIQKVEDRKVENFNFYKCEDYIYKTQKLTNVEVALRPQKFKTFCEIDSESWYNPLNLPEDKLLAFNKLIGFFIGDGYTDGGNRLEFHLKKERKINYLKEIVGLLGWELKEYPNNKYKVFLGNIGNFARNNYYDKKGNKQIPLELLRCNRDCIQAFIEGLMNSDGYHYNKNGFTYATTSEQVANILQGMVHIIGGHASINTVNYSDTNERWKNIFKMEICVPNTRSYIIVNDSRHKQKDVNIINYNGKIYCCEVSTGLLMVRRDNKVCLCGNSIAEHVNFTWCIEGVSRALLAQISRHRHISLSVQSQRYVEIKENIEDIDTLLMHLDASKETLMSIANKYFVDVNESNYLVYIRNLLDYLEAIQKGYKPEDARMFLPNATKTNMVISMNLRELIHICNLRLCNRAQLEIRKMVKEMALTIIDKEQWLKEYLQPSCEQLGYCPEYKGCGRKPSLQDKLKEKFVEDATINKGIK